MVRKKIPLYDLMLTPKAIRETARTLKSGWLTTGSKVAAFEKAVAKYAGVRYAAAVNSGSMGLFMALKLLGVAPGKEVITTPYSFVATTEIILHSGARPVFADINPRTLNIDPVEVQRKLSSQTACILPVDIAGYPADYKALGDICDRYKIPLISDACHSFGARYHNKSIPQVADAAVFSFHATKNLTCGEGGMVVSRHKEFVRAVKVMSLHGMTADAYQRKLKNRWEYDIVNLGMKANLSDVHASIGLGQLDAFDKNQKKRLAIADRYIKNLSPLAEFLELPPVEKSIQSAWHLFIIKLNLSRLKIDRDRFIEQMALRKVECGVHYKPIYDLSFYRKMGLTEQYFPNTAFAWRRVVTLPLFPDLKAVEVDYVCGVIREILKKYAK
ncbi:MAG: DegT/DnrJ/EryC1/StrS family aminotransferase [candidate division Zixibacteria bacterium]|nr:DegT/DnrJ/EryC1/StrS family aminotransferase [candidate division Zixibacteria bacterium]